MIRGILAVAVLALAVTACGGGSGPGSTPEATFEAAQNVVRNQDWKAFSNFIAPSALKEQEADFEKNKGGPGGAMMAAMFGIDPEKLKTMSFKDFMAAMLEKMAEKDPEKMATMLAQKVTDTKIEGNKATLTIEGGGEKDTVDLVQEDGKWYMADFN